MVIVEHANQKKSIVCAEGVLLALMEQKDSIVLRVIQELGMDSARVRKRIVDSVVAAMSALPDYVGGRSGQIAISQDFKNLFDQAELEMRDLGDDFISTGAVFLACFSPKVPGCAKILSVCSFDYEQTKEAIDSIRGRSKVTSQDDETRQSVLSEYTSDLTSSARKGDLDLVVCRNEEIERVIQILSRRKKNNPILVGEPGVGKTVIAEGLAMRISEANVPEYLLNKRVLSLEMGDLIAGAKMQGEFEERLKRIKDEVIASEGDIILFIDEIHTVIGAGRASGALDASNMLKPALAKGQLQCIGATTHKEYKKYIETDKALARRFQVVKVEEPSVDTTIQILKAAKQSYEAHHNVVFSDDAINAAAELASRYIPDRSLPDKAFDLLDEAGAAKRHLIINTPDELRDPEKRRQDLLDLKSEAFNEQDFERMAAYQMELAEIENSIKKTRDHIKAEVGKKDDHIVRSEDVAKIVSRQTGIPASRMTKLESEKFLKLESRLADRVIGQSHAIQSVSDAVRRNRSGLRDPNAPVASFLFLGPTGVGKTELAKAIAAEVLDDVNRLIRIDMSEFMERHEVSKLIGSPPGYVGFGEGGQLTEAIKRQPYSVVLFDEFEKAHPDVQNLLLQVLDEGWLTDGEGQKVSFRNAIIIGTSNLGSEILTEKKRPIGIGARDAEWSKDEESKEIFKVIKKAFRPEFINRIDEIIIFNRLGRQELDKILEILIADLKMRLSKLSIHLEFGQDAKEHLLSKLKTLDYGARPLKRKMQQLVENPISTKIIATPEGKERFLNVVLEGESIQIEESKVS